MAAQPNQKVMGFPSVWIDDIVASRHPGGVNCGFADGSVRFIKGSIDSWIVDPIGNCSEPRVHTRPGLFAKPVPGAKSASGRPSPPRGGEVISSDTY